MKRAKNPQNPKSLKKPKNPKGLEAFHQHYSQLYGMRWQALAKSLLSKGSALSLARVADFALQQLPPPIEYLSCDYWLDPASYLVSQILPPVEEGYIWDMCAAPGGKMLSIALHLPQAVKLYASELSSSRFKRLQQQLLFLPKARQKQIDLFRGNACLLALKYKNKGEFTFNRILLDAPCSSEAHLLQQAEQGQEQYIQQWSPQRSKRLAQNQVALLCAALDLLAEGASVLYITCALQPQENQNVVAKCLQKRNQNARQYQENPQLPPWLTQNPKWQLEPQEYGYQILPDRNEGQGPLYFCLLQRFR